MLGKPQADGYFLNMFCCFAFWRHSLDYLDSFDNRGWTIKNLVDISPNEWTNLKRSEARKRYPAAFKTIK